MARLHLKFENTTLKQFPLTQGGLSIGRLPDNDIQVDNPAVSGHHARIYWQSDRFVLEDNKSFNGTFVNDQRITTRALEDGDSILIGKHILTFQAEPLQDVAPASTAVSRPLVPSLDATAMLDTKKARELLAQASSKIAALPDVPTVTSASASTAPPAPRPKMRTGVLTVIAGKTDQSSYMLTGKLTVIGKSDMASIRLRGWFAPKVAAAINRRDERYFISPSGAKVKVNGQPIGSQWELNEGDMISVGRATLTFSYNE